MLSFNPDESHLKGQKRKVKFITLPRRGPEEVKKKTFSFALHVNCRRFPIRSIFNYTKVEQEGQVSLRGRL